VKELGKDDFSKIPNGLPGVEHRPALLYTHAVASGRITAADMARLLAENPARLFGMYPKRGSWRWAAMQIL
jgi:dihydropyrimidinase